MPVGEAMYRQKIKQPGRPAEVPLDKLCNVDDPERQAKFKQDLREIEDAERRADLMLDIRIR